jgi:hypothetical protein
MRTSRATVAVLVLFAVTGCVGGPLAGGQSASPASPSDSPAAPTASPASSPGGTPTECREPGDTPVDPVRESVDPSDYPDRPATWNESSVEAYVTAYERAYSRNDALRRKTRQVTVSVSDVSVETTDAGYRVRLVSRTNTWYGGTGEGTETATVVHGDGPLVPVLYEIRDDRLTRAEGGYEDTPTAGETRAVACWDGS